MISQTAKVKLAILSLSVAMLGPAFSACRSQPKIVTVEMVERVSAYRSDKERDPLRLVVWIDEFGRLKLNQIDTGRIDDPTVLNEKLSIIFADRENKGIDEREVVIDPQSDASQEDLERLIQNLAALRAAPIRVIKNDR